MGISTEKARNEAYILSDPEVDTEVKILEIDLPI